MKMLGSQVHRKVRAEDVPRRSKPFKAFRRRQKARETAALRLMLDKEQT